MKILYGTGNPAKLDAMRRRLSSLKIELIGLNDIDMEMPEISEDGMTPLENARKKALAYYNALHIPIPVFSCDSGLYIDNIPDACQPGVHVRTIGGRCLSDEEMLGHYTNLAKKYGDLTARYRNAICLVLDADHIYEAMDEDMESEAFIITSVPHRAHIKKEGFPLDCISLDIKTGKYYYDIEDSELDNMAVEDGFLRFFREHLSIMEQKTFQDEDCDEPDKLSKRT